MWQEKELEQWQCRNVLKADSSLNFNSSKTQTYSFKEHCHFPWSWLLSLIIIDMRGLATNDSQPRERWSRARKKAVRAMPDVNCHMITFFFFFFLSESCCGLTVEVCCCCCCCCCGSSSSSSGKRAYCKPGAEKQSFVKWPEKSDNLLKLRDHKQSSQQETNSVCAFHSFCYRTFAAALWACCVKYSLQCDPVARVISKLLTSSRILPTITHRQ